MKCKNCGKDIDIPNRVFVNLESYNVGGSAMSISGCCGIGYIVKMDVSFKITPYTGNSTEDEWGEKIKKYEVKND